MKKGWLVSSLFFTMVFALYAGGRQSAPPEPVKPPAPVQAEAPAKPAPAQAAPAPVSPFYTGDGGGGKSITILPPKPAGLTEDQGYIPGVVQGELVSNFAGYSAISVLDRLRLDDQYAELLSGYYDDNAEAGQDLGHLTPTDYMMGGSITKTASGYALQIYITRTADKTTAASYSGTCTFAELDTLSGIRRASLDLLQKLGVQPTERTKTELGQGVTASQAAAQTALSKGIEAMKKGTVVEALSYFIQSSNADPQLAEAASRVNIVRADITSGNAGADRRNDITWRKAWVERLAECDGYVANYRKNTPLGTVLVYSTDLQYGKTDYRTESLPISFGISLLIADKYYPDPVQGVVEAVYKGFVDTGRVSEWNLNWPYNSAAGGAAPVGWSETRRYDTAVELLNNRGEVIGKQTVRLSAGWNIGFNNGKTTVSNSETRTTVTFPAVDANKITERLSIRVASLNGTDAETATQVNRVSIMPWEDWVMQWDSQQRMIQGNRR